MSSDSIKLVRLFLLVEAVSFALAALPHYGILGGVYESQPTAIIVHSSIAGELFLGFALTWYRRARTRAIALTVQGVAVFAALGGVLTIAMGIGPQTVPEIGFHGGILVVLAVAIAISWRASRNSSGWVRKQ